MQTTDASQHPQDAVVSLGAVELSAAIHAQEISCVEVLDAYLGQIQRLNPQVNALVAPVAAELLYAQARALDQELRAGGSRGPIHGFPQAPKDIMPVAGMVTTKGSPLFADQVSATDAVVFERMRKGGAVFLARSNSPEFGLGGHTYNPVYGTTRNAFDLSRSAGGSSGGAAVAVALNMLPVADGSDMMGSLRTPAAFNSIYGFRPSFGLVPHGPAEEVFFQQFSVAGAMGRSVQDLALLLSVQAGPDDRLPLTRPVMNTRRIDQQLDGDLRGRRLAWCGDFGGHMPIEAGLDAVFESALERFGTAGLVVESAFPAFDYPSLLQAWMDLRCFSVAGANAALYASPEKRERLKPEARWEIERGLNLPAMRLYDAAKTRSAWYQTLRNFFRNFDYLLMPSAQVFPFDAGLDWPKSVGGRKMETYHQWMESAVPATMGSMPSLAVPAGFNADGLPAGLQLMGPAHADFSVLQAGHAYDQVTRPFLHRSPLLAAI